jgi:hypothetical protein
MSPTPPPCRRQRLCSLNFTVTTARVKLLQLLGLLRGLRQDDVPPGMLNRISVRLGLQSVSSVSELETRVLPPTTTETFFLTQRARLTSPWSAGSLGRKCSSDDVAVTVSVCPLLG